MTFFERYRYWINAGKFTAIQKVVVLAVGVLSFMILARMLRPSDFGVWGLFVSIAAISETGRTALVRNAFIKFMQTVEKEEEPVLQGAAFLLNLTVSMLLAVFFLLFSKLLAGYFNAPIISQMLRFYSLALVLSSLFTHAEMLLSAKMIFSKTLWLQITRQSIMLLLVVMALVSGVAVTPLTLVWFYITSICAGIIVGYMLCREYLSVRIEGSRDLLVRLWRFGRYVFGNNISSLLFRSTDTFVTSNYFGTTVTGLYNASLRISNLVDMPSVVFADILYPKAALFDRNDRLSVKHVYEKTVGATLVFSIPALLTIVIFPEFILRVLAGSKFVNAAEILRITAFFGFTLPFLRQFGTVMDATGQPHMAFRIMFFALMFNVLSNYLCVRYIGILGAAVGTAITYFLLFVISQLIMRKRYGVMLSNIFRNTWLMYMELMKYFGGTTLKRR